MTTCDEVPRYQLDGVECNETLESMFGVDFWNFTDDFLSSSVNDSSSLSQSSSTTCINWNAYYTECRPGSTNPFQGSISFDNIGLAWIAIFQVMSRLRLVCRTQDRLVIAWLERIYVRYF